MKKMLLNALGEILLKENYEKIKDLNKEELQKLMGLYHRYIKEFDGNKEVAKYYTNKFVEKGYVNELYSSVVKLLNKKIELHKEAIKRLEKMIRHYKTLI